MAFLVLALIFAILAAGCAGLGTYMLTFIPLAVPQMLQGELHPMRVQRQAIQGSALIALAVLLLAGSVILAIRHSEVRKLRTSTPIVTPAAGVKWVSLPTLPKP